MRTVKLRVMATKQACHYHCGSSCHVRHRTIISAGITNPCVSRPGRPRHERRDNDLYSYAIECDGDCETARDSLREHIAYVEARQAAWGEPTSERSEADGD